MTHPGTPQQSQGILVTGASTGIGECCALRLDKLGESTGVRVFAGVRKPEDGEALRAKASDRLIPVLLDVTEQDSIMSAKERITAEVGSGGLAGLVNNAGVVFGGPLEYMPLTALRNQFEINVFGQIAVTQAFAPLLRMAKGRIVMMSSIAGRCALPFVAPYSASKYALESLSDALRIELAAAGIKVAIVEPGSIRTPLWKKSRQTVDSLVSDYPPEAWERYGKAYEKIKQASAQSESRGIPPEAVADAVLHALTAKRPRIRYVVGNDAKLRLLLKVLPDDLFDWLIRRYLGI